MLYKFRYNPLTIRQRLEGYKSGQGLNYSVQFFGVEVTKDAIYYHR